MLHARSLRPALAGLVRGINGPSRNLPEGMCGAIRQRHVSNRNSATFLFETTRPGARTVALPSLRPHSRRPRRVPGCDRLRLPVLAATDVAGRAAAAHGTKLAAYPVALRREQHARCMAHRATSRRGSPHSQPRERWQTPIAGSLDFCRCCAGGRWSTGAACAQMHWRV